MEEKKLIILGKSARDTIKKFFGVSDSYVSCCLHFKINSLKARRIRREAVNFGKAVIV